MPLCCPEISMIRPGDKACFPWNMWKKTRGNSPLCQDPRFPPTHVRHVVH